MKRRSAILAMLALVGCAGPSRAEISEQLEICVNRPGSRVMLIRRHQGGFSVSTGVWTPLFSPGWSHSSKDTVETVASNWVREVWDIDTPEEARLIGITIHGFSPPDAGVGIFPDIPVYKLSTGVRDPRLSEKYTTSDTSAVFTKIHSWLNGTWDVDRSNERSFVKDTLNVAP